MSDLIKLVGGHQAARELIVGRPAGAVYWDRIEKGYVKGLIVDPDSGYVAWRYLSQSGEWHPRDSINDPIHNGDFIVLDQLRKLVPLTTQEYLEQYYSRHQNSLATDQGFITSVEAKHVRKSKHHTAFWIFTLAVLVAFVLVMRGCLWVH